MVNKDLKRRIIEIAYKYKLSHLGSYFSCVDAIEFIYEQKKPEDIFILSNGHAALALYVVLEKHYGHNAEVLFNKHGGHPHIDEDNHIYCSTGSLGMGLSVAVGRALARKDRKVHVMVSDGECAEGVIWEALKFLDTHYVPNIHVYVMANGYGAYDPVHIGKLNNQISAFNNDGRISMVYCTSEEFPFLHDLNAHYHIMKEPDYKLAMEMTECEKTLPSGS
jgi:transketolase N-terminal domain/subunit